METISAIIDFIKANRLRAILAALAVIGLIPLIIFISSKVHEKLTLEFIIFLVKRYGYYLIFALVMLGNIGVPVPEESPVIVAGFASQQGLLDYKIAVLVCIFSAIFGDNIGYLIGRKGGRKLILRYGRYVHINEEKLKKFEGFFIRYGDKTVFFARFIAGLRWLAGPLSGAAQMRFSRFLTFNAMGAVVWVLFMTQLGYHFGAHLPRLLSLLGKANIAIATAALLVIIAVYYIRKRRARP